MRNIMFRGKRSYNNEWVIGNLIVDNCGYIHIVPIKDIYLDGHHIVMENEDIPMFFEEETIGQFIGLYDSNGKRIFDGDRVRYCDDYDEDYIDEDTGDDLNEWNEAVITWCGEYPAFDFDHHDYESNALSHIFGIGGKIEVIGNIHDKETT